MKKYWLMKSEPHTFSITDLKRLKQAPWDGVRNFQARNYMRAMQPGDDVLFYHSSAEPTGVAGRARVVHAATPDPTAWDPKSAQFDKRSNPEKPLWFMVDVQFVDAFPRVISLAQLRQHPALKNLLILRKGNRLSVTPVTPSEFKTICSLR